MVFKAITELKNKHDSSGAITLKDVRNKVDRQVTNE